MAGVCRIVWEFLVVISGQIGVYPSFESPEAVAIKAERLIKANQMPLIIVFNLEDKIGLSLLQFPLLLAFAPDPQTIRRDDFYFDSVQA